MNKLFIIFLLALFVSCHNREAKKPEDVRGQGYGRQEQRRNRYRGGHTNPAAIESISLRGDTAYVPAGSPADQKLSLYTVNHQEHSIRFATTGTVNPLPGHMAHVATPFDGRVVKSFIKLGQRVTAGTPLFEVNSSDYLESVRMYQQARRERELAEINYLRKKDLMDSGITSKREFDEAKLEFDLAEKEYEKTSAIMQIFNLNPEEADMSKPLIVRSPISGEIVHTDITVGQYIKSDSDPIVTVADLDRICVTARVKEKDLGVINVKDRVEVITESYPGRPINGVVNYVGNIMDEQTRSVEVFLECENQDKILKPGMFVTTLFYHQITDAIIIPSGAVLQKEGTSFVFVKAGNGIYIKRSVVTSAAGERNLIVQSGINNGDIIVSEGAIYLR